MSNKNIFNCETCEKIFVNSFSLKRHMKAIHHSGILFKSKTTKCILCKDNVSSNEYNKHLVVNHQIKINNINMDFDGTIVPFGKNPLKQFLPPHVIHHWKGRH